MSERQIYHYFLLLVIFKQIFLSVTFSLYRPCPYALAFTSIRRTDFKEFQITLAWANNGFYWLGGTWVGDFRFNSYRSADLLSSCLLLSLWTHKSQDLRKCKIWPKLFLLAYFSPSVSWNNEWASHNWLKVLMKSYFLNS